MTLAWKGIIPPYKWEHDPNIRNNYGYTVEHFLIRKNIEVPE